MIYVGKAGWSLRKEHQPRFPEGETHLQRYAQKLPVVEINSSFRNWHRPSTYARWADSVPEAFRFSVKVHQDVTHKGNLEEWEPMSRFLSDTANLDEKLSVYLVQLPPSHAFNEERARLFFGRLWKATDVEIVCEPRHGSWFKRTPENLLTELEVGRVAADPSMVRKSPGQTKFEPILLERGRTHDDSFEKWVNKVWNFGAGLGSEVSLKDFRKDIVIELYNEAGQLVMAFYVYRCWPSHYTALSDLEANETLVALESITLQHEGWERDYEVTEPEEPSYIEPK